MPAGDHSKPESGDSAAERATGQRLLRNLGWYGLAEATSRVSRIGTTVVLARWLGAEELGIAAAALTAFELVRAFTSTGIGQAVARAFDADLEATCNAAHRAVWWVCGALVLLQATLGGVLAMLGTGAVGRAGPMLACLGGVYLAMAPGLVPAYRLQRRNQLGVTARAAMLQALADNALTAGMVLAGCGAWGVVLPKLLVAPIWLWTMRRAEPWRPDRAAGEIPAATLWRFALPVLGSELLAVARLHLDKMLVGITLGTEALGTYWFVFNAGLGLSLSISGALSSALFPHFAELASKPAALLRRFDKAVRSAALPAAGLVTLQAAASLFYVPVVFGAHWAAAATLVAAMSLSAATRPIADATAQLLRAVGLPRAELTWAAWMTTAQLLVLAAALPFGLGPSVVAPACAALLGQAAFAVSGRRTAAAHARGHATMQAGTARAFQTCTRTGLQAGAQAGTLTPAAV